MGDFLLGLVSGIGLIVVVNLVLFRFSSLGATRSAIVVALLSVGAYLLIALFRWPGGDIMAMHLAVYLLTAYACGVFLRQRVATQDKPSGQRFHWAPVILVGFFGFLVVLFSLFILVAERGLPSPLISCLFPGLSAKVTSVFPGVISHDFQQKETLYNDYLLQLRRQQERGWRVQKGWLQRPVMGRPTVFRVVARTREGEPLHEGEVTGQFLRPSNSRLDVAFSMQELEPGTYEASVSLPAAGTWDLVLQLRQGQELHEIRATTEVLTP
jgi:nitrogen fixation protein FixH